jgi:signal transduction histidine kinase
VKRAEADVELAIADDGRGFNPVEVRSRRGLGLLSLDERVRLVGGRLTVDTRPPRGTELRIVVPIAEVKDAPRDRVAG